MSQSPTAGEGQEGNVLYSETFSWADSKAAWSAVVELYDVLCIFPLLCRLIVIEGSLIQCYFVEKNGVVKHLKKH